MPSSIKRVDRGKKALVAQLKARLVAKVGFPHESNPVHKDAHIKVAELAVVHEYGSVKRGIPARPFMRETGKRERKTARKLFGALHRLMVNGGITKRQMMGRLGVWYSSEMKETITQHGHALFIPLKRATVVRKGSDRPLLDTAGMKNAITSVVTTPEAVR